MSPFHQLTPQELEALSRLNSQGVMMWLVVVLIAAMMALLIFAMRQASRAGASNQQVAVAMTQLADKFAESIRSSNSLQQRIDDVLFCPKIGCPARKRIAPSYETPRPDDPPAKPKTQRHAIGEDPLPA